MKLERDGSMRFCIVICSLEVRTPANVLPLTVGDGVVLTTVGIACFKIQVVDDPESQRTSKGVSIEMPCMDEESEKVTGMECGGGEGEGQTMGEGADCHS